MAAGAPTPGGTVTTSRLSTTASTTPRPATANPGAAWRGRRNRPSTAADQATPTTTALSQIGATPVPPGWASASSHGSGASSVASVGEALVSRRPGNRAQPVNAGPSATAPVTDTSNT